MLPKPTTFLKLKAGGFELRPSQRPQHFSKTLTCDCPLLCFYKSPLDQKATRVNTRIPCGLLADWSHPFELGPRGSACGNPSSRAAFGRIHRPDSCNPSHLNCRSGHRMQDCCRRSHSSSSVAMTERSTTARDSRRTCPPASGPIQARRSSLRPDVRVRLRKARKQRTCPRTCHGESTGQSRVSGGLQIRWRADKAYVFPLRWFRDRRYHSRER